MTTLFAAVGSSREWRADSGRGQSRWHMRESSEQLGDRFNMSTSGLFLWHSVDIDIDHFLRALQHPKPSERDY